MQRLQHGGRYVVAQNAEKKRNSDGEKYYGVNLNQVLSERGGKEIDFTGKDKLHREDVGQDNQSGWRTTSRAKRMRYTGEERQLWKA